MADIQQLIAAIPDAISGDPITIAHHNTMKQAIVELAQIQPGGSPPAGTVINVVPEFRITTEGTDTGWNHGLGFATTSRTGQDVMVDGWSVLSLPEGLVVESVVVTGRIVSSGAATENGSLEVTILAAKPSDLRAFEILRIRVWPTEEQEGENFVRRVEDPFTVSNAALRYMIQAIATNPPGRIDIYSIQFHGHF